MRTLIALLTATFLLLAACGDDEPTPVTAGPGDDTETTDGSLPPETTDAPVTTDADPVDEAPTTDLDPDGEALDPDGDEATPSGEQLEAELAAARARWAELDVRDYTMEQTVVAQLVDYVGPFTVAVTDGVVSDVAYAASALSEADAPPADVEVATVEDIFDLIERSIGVADEVRVTYDAETGVPTDVWIDESFQMADEEIGYTVVFDGEG